MTLIRSGDVPDLVLFKFYDLFISGGTGDYVDDFDWDDVRPFNVSEQIIEKAIGDLNRRGVIRLTKECKWGEGNWGRWRINDAGVEWMEKLIDLNSEFFKVYFEKGEDAISIDEFRALKRP